MNSFIRNYEHTAEEGTTGMGPSVQLTQFFVYMNMIEDGYEHFFQQLWTPPAEEGAVGICSRRCDSYDSVKNVSKFILTRAKYGN